MRSSILPIAVSILDIEPLIAKRVAENSPIFTASACLAFSNSATLFESSIMAAWCSFSTRFLEPSSSDLRSAIVITETMVVNPAISQEAQS